ncbi:MAG: 16S rRNA (uracil1498-N3)-methyltransferase [Rhodothermales bacterium]|jgi:16S rRNA (uracil1498-N3)-methyltransferase
MPPGTTKLRISRIYTKKDLQPDTGLSLDEKASHYVSKVLRLRLGDPLVIFNGDGFDYAAEVITVGKKVTELALHARLPAAAESGLQITLVQAVSRGERMDISLQKATELGVSNIQLLLTDHVEVRFDEKRLNSRMSHWSGVIIAACEQSGRAIVPGLYPPILLEAWLSMESSALRLALEPVSDHSLSGQSFGDKTVEILVGPEGGFSDMELKKLKVAAVTTVSLGPRILRTETAGPAAIAVLQALAGDF